MRLSKLAFFLVCCAACDGPETHFPDGSAGEDDDGGSAGAGGSSADASVDAFVDWGLLEAEEIATPEAAEQIAALECGEFEPCGGDLVGTWNVEGFCVTSALNIATQGVQNCPGVLAAFERSASGTMRFSADGVQDADVTISGMQHLVLGDPCMQHLYHQDASEEACILHPLRGSAQRRRHQAHGGLRVRGRRMPLRRHGRELRRVLLDVRGPR
jgi:hypothetical protein